MDYKKSLEAFEKALPELREDNKNIPIIVEGENDIEALHRLDVSGTIISLNKGVPLIDFCDMLARKYREIIILTDWDRKGGFLCHTIKKNLEGRTNCNTKFRAIFAKNAAVRTLEGLPSWLDTIKEKLAIVKGINQD